jgi:hypothetical protein
MSNAYDLNWGNLPADVEAAFDRLEAQERDRVETCELARFRGVELRNPPPDEKPADHYAEYLKERETL